MTPVQSPCPCGSGLPFARCHADSRNEFARGQALREAEMIGSLFPAVRVAGADVEAFADRVASSLPDEAPEVEGSVMEEASRSSVGPSVVESCARGPATTTRNGAP